MCRLVATIYILLRHLLLLLIPKSDSWFAVGQWKGCVLSVTKHNILVLLPFCYNCTNSFNGSLLTAESVTLFLLHLLLSLTHLACTRLDLTFKAHVFFRKYLNLRYHCESQNSESRKYVGSWCTDLTFFSKGKTMCDYACILVPGFNCRLCFFSHVCDACWICEESHLNLV